MPNRFTRSCAALLASGLLFADLAGAQEKPVDTRPGIAVMPFFAGVSTGPEKENLDALSVGLQQILITELAQNPALRVVDRSVIQELLAEQDLAADGRVDRETAARVGKIVGARYAFLGGFNYMNGRFYLDGRIDDGETSEVVKALRVDDKGENMYGVILKLAERIMKDLKLPPLAVEQRQERQSRGGGSIPRQAVILYSQAQFFQDRGQKDKAKELYRRITTEFPRLTEAKEALRRIEAAES